MKRAIEKILKQAGVVGEIQLTVPPNPAMGDLSFACFDLAKKNGKNPVDTAKELAGKIKKSDLVEKVQAIGPYVNFFFNAGLLAESVIKQIKKERNKFGASQARKGEKILIEYPSNNTHKEVHVGHLRNICIGNALVNLYEVAGAKVIPINYINDFGVHVAKCLWGLNNLQKGKKTPINKQKWLGQVYAEASKFLADHPEKKEEIKEYLRQLESQDKKIWKLFLTTRQWSLDGFVKIFKELGIKHQTTFFEKDVKEIGQKMVDELLKKKIAQVGDGGAIIVDLKKYNLDMGLLRKSDGAGLYLTSDLGLAKVKAKKFPQVTQSVNLTGTEQNFYFKQLFKILELSGFKYKMTHVSYELVTLPEGKMSSRLGNVILYEDLRDEAVSLAESETKKRHADWSATKIQKIAHALALGALKFSMVKVGPKQIITFNLKEALSFDGFTGPYLQYSIARMNSILKKVGTKSWSKNLAILQSTTEKQLVLKLSGFSASTSASAIQNDPSQLAKYLYELAKLFSEFYEQCPVLKAEKEELRAARLELVKATKLVMENGLRILGVPVVEEM
jgi:arginyl-tRNA synthetase